MHDREAGRYHPIDVASRRLAVAAVKKLCRPLRPEILDVGCGSGWLLDDLAAAMPGATVSGMDSVSDLKGPLWSPGRIWRQDICTCQLADASFDAITCLNVLEHIDRDDLALEQIRRLLKPGGIAHIEVPACPGLYDSYDRALLHYRRYRMADLVALAEAAGFRVIRRTHLGFFIFPAFAVSKLWNRWFGRRYDGGGQALVAARIRRTAGSRALAALLGLELALGRWINFPIGIRCVVDLRKRHEVSGPERKAKIWKR